MALRLPRKIYRDVMKTPVKTPDESVRFIQSELTQVLQSMRQEFNIAVDYLDATGTGRLYFGDESDGDLTITEGSLTLTRSMQYRNVLISGGTLFPSGYFVFARSVTVSGSGKIYRNGGNAANSTASAVGAVGAGAAGGIFGAGTDGGTENANGANCTDPAYGGRGGQGGAIGGGSSRRSAGTCLQSVAKVPGQLIMALGVATTSPTGFTFLSGGSGGGGGNEDSTGNAGAGGGGGGGIVIVAETISLATGAVRVSATGGSGGEPDDTAAFVSSAKSGAGGGGGGGFVVLAGISIDAPSGTVSVAGGRGGTGYDTQSTQAFDGSAGNILVVQLS